MKLSNLANVLREAGLTVVETHGWANRGYAGQDLQDVRGVLWHHTATHRSRFTADAPTLAMCINGRSDLPGPLCNIVFGRTGAVYLVAAGVANHAGAGTAHNIPTNMGNHYLIGIEMESSGIAPWDWTLDQLRVAPHLGAALERAYGVSLQLAHYEYSSQGKIDPAGWPGGMDGLRAQINAVLNGTISTQSTSQEDDMANVPQHEWNAVRDAANRINGVITDPHAKVLTTNDIGAIADAVLDEGITDAATGKQTSPRTKFAWLKHEQALASNQLAALEAKVDALTELAASGSVLSKEEASAVLKEAIAASFGRYELTKVDEDVA